MLGWQTGRLLQGMKLAAYGGAYIVVALLYLLLAVILKLAFYGFGQIIVPRRRRLGTAL